MEVDWKFEILKKLLKNPQKILEYRSRRADSKNIARLWSRIRIFEISVGDSEKMVGVIRGTKQEVTSRG